MCGRVSGRRFGNSASAATAAAAASSHVQSWAHDPIADHVSRWPAPAHHSPNVPAANPARYNDPAVTMSQPTGCPAARRTTNEPTAT